MGNLPTSRTATLVNGDAVPSNLLNEIQDQFVGDKRTTFRPTKFIGDWVTAGGAPTVIVNPQAGGAPVPVWNLPTGTTHRGLLTYEVGDVISDVVFDVFGDGAADLTLNMQFVSDLTAAPATSVSVASSGGAIVDSPASWTRYTMSALGLGGGVVLTTLPLGYLSFEATLVGGAQIRLGQIWLVLAR